MSTEPVPSPLGDLREQINDLSDRVHNNPFSISSSDGWAAFVDGLLPLFAARVAAIEADLGDALADVADALNERDEWNRRLTEAEAERDDARGKLADAWDEGWGAGWGDVERDETSANPYRTGEGTPAVVCRHGNNSDDCGSCHWEGHGR